MPFKLADFFCQFSAQGHQELKKEFETLKRQMEDMSDAGEKVGTEMKQQFRSMSRDLEESKKKADQLKEAYATVAGGMRTAFAAASLTLTGFIRAGLQGTSEGNAFALSMQQLSREIASLFLPVIRSAIRLVQDLTGWFRSLDGSTQRLVGSTILWVGLFGTGVIILPKLVAGFTALVSVIRGLAAALAAANIASGGLLAALGAIAAVVITISAFFSKIFGGGKKEHDAVSPGMGTIEQSAAQQYSRIQLSSLKTDTDMKREEANKDMGVNVKALLEKTQATNEKLDAANTKLDAIRDKKVAK
ncbi:MAG TPA: hypothetical protein VEA69_22935 [Tepidisphaeraceae bacterium]|nr:hypothetical protein [Tepidisphaeraceae bacterium]